MTSLANDDRFTVAPQWIQDELKKYDPTFQVGATFYHEVEFEATDNVCRCAIVNGKYIAAPHGPVDTFTGVLKVWQSFEISELSN